MEHNSRWTSVHSHDVRYKVSATADTALWYWEISINGKLVHNGFAKDDVEANRACYDCLLTVVRAIRILNGEVE